MRQADSGHAVKCSLIAAVVRRFGVARLRVNGTSMLPSIWPDDVVTVQQRTLSEVQTGQIALFTRNGRLFAHRIVDRCPAGLITKGDALSRADHPVTAEEFLGIVTAVHRGSKQFQPSARLSRPARVSAAVLRGSPLLRRTVPLLVTAWNT